MEPKSQGVLLFGDHQLDAQNRLTRAGQPIPLPPTEGAVLRRIAEGRGRTVSKKDLLEGAWPGVEPSDESLTRCIYALRLALEDMRKPYRFIKTVHGRGYRFAGKLLPVADGRRAAPWIERASQVDPRVFEAFLHARWLWDERSPEQLDRAVAILNRRSSGTRATRPRTAPWARAT